MTDPLTNQPSLQQALRFNFGKAKKGGNYDVCYCQHHNDCVSDLDFFQSVANVIIGGVSDAADDHVCFLNKDCNVRVQGTILNSKSKMINYKKASVLQGECASAGGSNAFFTYPKEFKGQYVETNFNNKDITYFEGDKGNFAGLDYLDFQMGEPKQADR